MQGRSHAPSVPSQYASIVLPGGESAAASLGVGFRSFPSQTQLCRPEASTQRLAGA